MEAATALPGMEEKKENSSSPLDKANVQGRPDEHCEVTVDAIGAKGKQRTQGGCRDWGRWPRGKRANTACGQSSLAEG